MSDLLVALDRVRQAKAVRDEIQLARDDAHRRLAAANLHLERAREAARPLTRAHEELLAADYTESLTP